MKSYTDAHTPMYSYVCMRACFFRFTLPAAFEFFSLAASCQGLHTPACTHTHTGTAHFDPSPLMDHRTHVLLIFLPIPGQQWHVGKSCAYEAKTISCQCCFIFGQKLAENFSDTGPLIHLHFCRGILSHTHTHTHGTRQTKSSPQNNVAKLQKI